MVTVFFQITLKPQVFLTKLICFVTASFELNKKTIYHCTRTGRWADKKWVDSLPHGDHLRWRRGFAGSGRTTGYLHISGRWAGICSVFVGKLISFWSRCKIHFTFFSIVLTSRFYNSLLVFVFEEVLFTWIRLVL